jgi:hypothetical protein
MSNRRPATRALSRLTALAFVMSSLLLPSGNALATQDNSTLPQPAVAALDELKKTGKLSDSARSTLLKYPDIAAQVGDPNDVVLEGSTAPRPATTSGSVTGCWISDFNVRHQSLLGVTMFRFHQQAHWCANGSAVTSVHVRFHHLTEVGSNVYFRSLIGNWVGGVPAWYVESYMQGHIELCVVKYGCYANLYPWVKIKMWGNNTHAGEWGV